MRCFLLLCVAACGDPASASGSTAHALLIGLDGVRPDALLAAETPVLDGLAAAGRATLAASTQVTAPAKSSPGWASVLTGVEAERHGVGANYESLDPDVPTVIARLRRELGSETFVTAGWYGIELLLAVEERCDCFSGTDADAAARMGEALAGETRALYFMHLVDIDETGHRSGFAPDNPEYIAAIERADAQVGQLLDAVERRTTRGKESWLFVVTTDHGGEGLDHGPATPANQTIFLIAAGDGVPSGAIGSGATHMDVAPTLLRHLGLAPAADLDGRAL